MLDFLRSLWCNLFHKRILITRYGWDQLYCPTCDRIVVREEDV